MAGPFNRVQVVYKPCALSIMTSLAAGGGGRESAAGRVRAEPEGHRGSNDGTLDTIASRMKMLPRQSAFQRFSAAAVDVRQNQPAV
jgi:hypothetical protein